MSDIFIPLVKGTVSGNSLEARFLLRYYRQTLGDKTFSTTLAKRTRLRAAAKVRNSFAEGRGQIDLMILLLHQDLTNLFRHGIFSKHFTLPDAVAVIADGFVLIVEIVAEHVLCIFRGAHG